MAKLSIPLTARIDVLPVRGGEGLVQRIFEPLGYTVETTRHPPDIQFPEWGESPYSSLTIAATTILSELLTHLCVMVPVFDNQIEVPYEPHALIGNVRSGDPTL